MAGWFEAVLPVASAFLGAGTGFGGVWLAQSRQDRREREARQHGRAAAAVARCEEFELQHLVEVNQLLRAQWEALDALRIALRAYLTRRRRASRAGEPFDERYPPEERYALDTAAAAVSAQMGFILADGVRPLVETAHKRI